MSSIAPSLAVGPPPVNPIRGQLSESMSKRGMDYSTYFPIDTLLSEHPDIQDSVAMIASRGWGRILGPFSYCFPRLVRLFYQNLRHIRGVMTSVIDGVTIEVTEDLAREVLHIPAEAPVLYALMPSDLSNTEKVAMLDVFPVVAGISHTCRSRIPSKLWFLDTVLRSNLCGQGHSENRRGEFLTALCAANNNYFFNLPGLILSEISSFHQRVIQRTAVGTHLYLLPFPNIISSFIVSQPNFVLRMDEERDVTQIVYSSKQWKRSRDTLLSINKNLEQSLLLGNAIPINLETDEPYETPIEIPAPAYDPGQSSNWPMGQNEYTSIREDLGALRLQLHDHHQQHERDMDQILKKLDSLGEQMKICHGELATICSQIPTMVRESLDTNPLWFHPGQSSHFPPTFGGPSLFPPPGEN